MFSQTLEWTLYKCENVEVVLYGHTSLGLLLGKENGFGIVSRDKKLISISGSLFHLNWNDFGDTLSAGSVWSFAKIISLALKGWHTVVLLTKTASSSLKAGSHTVQSDHEITHVDCLKIGFLRSISHWKFAWNHIRYVSHGISIKIEAHTGAKINFLSRNYQEFDVWKMWILWKMTFWNCEFSEKWDSDIVIVKNET